MTENVQIALIAAIALVAIVGIVVFVLKNRLRSSSLKVNRDGLEGNVKTHSQPVSPVTRVSRNTIIGDGHELTARNGGQI
ncbi:MAG: hypothetical protein D3923_08915, partial [Candidatus Electrothrix sp. AR3]|nr:hypothetical protein [Candidatus Electrothrix sp. AR3]